MKTYCVQLADHKIRISAEGSRLIDDNLLVLLDKDGLMIAMFRHWAYVLVEEA